MSAEQLMALLKKYMQFIFDEEGTTYVGRAEYHVGTGEFTDEEIVLLLNLREEIE